MAGVAWLVERAAAALFLDPGAGKTSITLAACTVLKNEGMFLGALVVTTLRPAVSVWPQEVEKWADFEGLDLVVLHGRHKERLVNERHDIYVINYEGLPWLINSGHLARMLKSKWLDVLALDELTKMKNAGKKAARRKLLWKWLPRFARRWGLTGSPASNSLIHLFGQINVLDLGATFGPYISHFKNMYFTPIGEWDWVLKAGADKLIYERIAPIALRTELGKGVKVPEVRHNTIKIELPDAARKAYDEMELEMLTTLCDDMLAAGSAGAAYGKCRQIATGAVFKSKIDPVTGEPILRAAGEEKWHNVHDEKLDALSELLEDLQGQQALIGYWFQHDLAKLRTLFGDDVPYIGSGVSVKKALEYEAAWNAGELPVLLGHPQSMGHGLNLQGSSAHHIIWYTPTPDYELTDQFIRRLRRRGNKAKVVTSHYIVADRTVESWGVMPMLRRRERTQTNMFSALRELARLIKK